MRASTQNTDGRQGRRPLPRRRRAKILSVVATFIAMLGLAGVALGSDSETRGAAGKSPIVIRSQISAHQTSDGTYKGRFVLVLNGAIEDSGTTVIRPANGPLRTVGGSGRSRSSPPETT